MEIGDIRQIVDNHFRRGNGTYRESRNSRYDLTKEIFTFVKWTAIMDNGLLEETFIEQEVTIKEAMFICKVLGMTMKLEFTN